MNRSCDSKKGVEIGHRTGRKVGINNGRNRWSNWHGINTPCSRISQCVLAGINLPWTTEYSAKQDCLDIELGTQATYPDVVTCIASFTIDDCPLSPPLQPVSLNHVSDTTMGANISGGSFHQQISVRCNPIQAKNGHSIKKSKPPQ
jgi:hypothetical protein